MNVLDATNTPRVMSLPEVLRAFLDHRQVVLRRRTIFRLKEIERRLEILEGYLIAYLNLDEVIRIIREEDEPKAVMMKRFDLTDLQAESILNMRLRSLRKLEEMEIRKEHKALSVEQKDLKALLKDDERQWKLIGEQIAEIRKKFGAASEGGKRRSDFGDAPSAVVIPLEAMVEREPVTVICSDKGWIRVLKGHVEANGELKFKEGDRARFALHAETTDKLLLLGTNGRFYTLGVDKLPGGRGHGEPIRLMVDLGNDQDIVALFVHKPERKLLVASSDGRGFVVPEAEVLAQTRAGKQVLNVGEGGEAEACAMVEGDHVAVVGDNRKLVIFKLDEVPEMTRGRGVILQKFKDGGLVDAKMVTLAEGLLVRQGEVRTRLEADLAPWLGARATAGRMAPKEIVRSGKF
jgi:topoisomerase-4 subunit A